MRVLVPLLVSIPLLALPAIAQAQSAKSCFDATVPLTIEEQRLTAALQGDTVAVGPELVRLAGFDAMVDDFTGQLCSTSTVRRAQRLVTTAGGELWQTSVDRAQGRRPGLGTLDTYDDRPLYWARLQMSKALRQWTPRFAVDRTALLKSFNEGSRGVDSVKFPLGSLTRRVLVSGFDPFQLNGSGVRISNPAGATALQLDGKILKTPNGPAIVQAVSFPVVWGYFDQGIVEEAYGTALQAKARRPDVIVTISQGRPSQFDIERWASAWRGGVPDNNNVGVRGQIPKAAGWPQPDVQFIETTLPYQRMIDSGSGSYPVNYNRSFCVWSDSVNPGTGPRICRTDEPKAGEMAASGGGGDYLSNESMYRSNRVRLGLGAAEVAGGHLHTPVLGTPGDPLALTDAAFEARRKAIADQAVALTKAAA